ncbi:hypothetical protein [Brevibacterium album]|uniref:hypothetical protein n=1 Tax=Brevibacterium album TaxID=417948 RepID=UPI00041669D9|nr:hypothetical protein [Brevibacterium album]
MSSAFGIPDSSPETAPGLARTSGPTDETLAELAPYIEEEGVDLDDPASIDPDELDAALARATRRRNEQLFTAEGRSRVQALALLGEVAEAVAAGQLPVAQAILGAVEPEASASLPSVAHVIGTALELVDAWHTDPELGAGMLVVPAPKVPRDMRWDRKSRTVATDVLAIARKGRAHDALGSLITRYGGTAVLEGTALAVAGFLTVLARKRQTGVAALAQELLTREAPGVADIREVFAAPEPAAEETAPAPAAEQAEPESAPEAASGQRPSAEASPVPELSSSSEPSPASAAVSALLAWVGEGRPVARSGGLRRADIEPVAEMLGIRAKGVGRRVEAEPGDETVYAMSMAEVPELAVWWQDLIEAQLIEVTSTRVRRGPAAAA